MLEEFKLMNVHWMNVLGSYFVMGNKLFNNQIKNTVNLSINFSFTCNLYFFCFLLLLFFCFVSPDLISGYVSFHNCFIFFQNKHSYLSLQVLCILPPLVPCCVGFEFCQFNSCKRALFVTWIYNNTLSERHWKGAIVSS